MQLFRDSNIDFMRQRKLWLPVSVVAFVASIVVLFGLGHLNIGIDFAGGTQLTIRFAESPDLPRLRGVVAEAGFPDAQIHSFGEDEDNEVMIKTPLVEGDEEGSRLTVERALDTLYNPEGDASFDVNQQGSEALASLLLSRDPDGVTEELDAEAAREHYRRTARRIIDQRQARGILTSWEQITPDDRLSEAALQALQSEGRLGRYTVLASENVGPQIGEELRLKGILAVVFSLLGMLAYIWVRFELRFGLGALAALVHDVVIALGLYALMGYEFNLSTIAAFLTVVGYSVNDTVVVFDRVRENLRKNRREPLVSLMNRSLNQTLSRTVLTSGTTLLVVVCLFVFGGDVIRGFAFVLMIGVVIGTYSSIFVASPVVLMWERFYGREARSRRSTAAAT